jgi:hypothetical protein
MDYVTPEAQRQQRVRIHPSQHQHFVTPIASPLHVITVIENPNRFYTRYKLYQAFEQHIQMSGAILHTVELAFRNRHFEVTSHDNPNHVQLRSPSQLWHKENLMNVALRSLPADWEYVAWIDADVLFMRPDWVQETIQQLQHYHVVQLFSHAVDLGPKFQPLTQFQGFAYSYVNGAPPPKRVGNNQHYYYSGGNMWHPGYAWAARRSALSDLGGFGDIGILGSSDHHMACALIGKVSDSLHNGVESSYREYWNEWEARAEQYVRRNIGFVEGTLAHYWHGSKKARKYVDRWQILIQNKYDWRYDIKKDVQGVYQLTERNPKLRDQIRGYFAQRNEDSIDL